MPFSTLVRKHNWLKARSNQAAAFAKGLAQAGFSLYQKEAIYVCAPKLLGARPKFHKGSNRIFYKLKDTDTAGCQPVDRCLLI